MNVVQIDLAQFGKNLGSRNLGESVFNEFKNELIVAEKVIVDFENVDKMTLSFGTELFDSIYSLGKSIETVNANNFISRIIKFCLSNQKAKQELVLS